MDTITRFQFFDPTQEYFVTYGDLPHWEQPGATYFITFRTVDSIPRETYRVWLNERDDWLTRRTGIANAAWHEKVKSLSAVQRREFSRLFHNKLEQYLDQGLGDCPFRQAELANVVVNSLRHFDGQRYHLGDFVVMPNHVHLLVCLFKEWRLRAQCHSWKRYMAREINRLRDTRGCVFQTESFDHLVRDGDHFEKFRGYIQRNPERAGLGAGSYQLG